MTVVGPGVLDAELRSRGTRVSTQLVFRDETTFSVTGTIDFGKGDAVRFASHEDGTLAPSGDGRLRHGTSVLDVVGGAGRYRDASGRITSNFVVAHDGEVTDEQVLVLFIDRKEE
jgi:hypothetical protein